MVGAVGNDDFAEPALALLRAGSVDLSRVRTAEDPTGVALILVDAAGENVIAVIPGANGAVGEADAAASTRSADDVLLLQLEVPVAAIAAAAERARAAGARVILNFAPFREDALGLLRYATHLVVNESECALVADALGVAAGSLDDQAAALAEKQAMTVIVTLGKDGVLAVDDGRTETAPALQVEAVDTVGAGDTFCGYLAAGSRGGHAAREGAGLRRRGRQPRLHEGRRAAGDPMRAEVEARAGIWRAADQRL